jgi:hypothetical protein
LIQKKKNFIIDEDFSLRDYNRLTQLNFAAFKYLIIIINNEALKKIEKE